MESQTSDIRVAVEEPKTWARRLTITVPAERVERERQDVLRKLATRIRLPGFRPGKVPSRVVEQRFGAAIDQEALEKLVGEAYKEALQQHGFQPITQGAVEGLDYHPGNDLTFNVEFEIRPEIRLDRVSGFRVQRQVTAIEDDDVQRVLQRLREENAVWRPLEDGTPVAGDMVDIEVTPLTEGEDAEPRPYRIVLGEGQAVEDMEDAIRTLKPGEEGEFTIRIQDEEGGEPKERRTRVRLKEAQRPELPTLDDDFAKSLGEFEDLNALNVRVREDLEAEAQAEAERTLRHQLLTQIIDANPFDVPESMVSQYLDRLLRSPEGMPEERMAEIRASTAPAAQNAIKRMLVIERIAELNGLHATQDEVDDRVAALAERRSRPVGEVWAQLQKSGRLQQMEEEITEEKVFDFLKAQSTIE